MRVDDVNQSKGIGYIKFNTDTEMNLIQESMDRLIAKQQKLAEKIGDREEKDKLERFKKSKVAVIDRPKEHKLRLKNIHKNIKDKTDEMNKNNNFAGAQNDKKPKIDVEDTEEFKNAARVVADSEIDSGLREGTEVTHRNMHVLANALNDHIWEMEKSGTNKSTRRNQIKYEKLKQLLNETQEQKAKFERHTPRPKGFGRLRK